VGILEGAYVIVMSIQCNTTIDRGEDIGIALQAIGIIIYHVWLVVLIWEMMDGDASIQAMV
jgi:hypothetical protein